VIEYDVDILNLALSWKFEFEVVHTAYDKEVHDGLYLFTDPPSTTIMSL